MWPLGGEGGAKLEWGRGIHNRPEGKNLRPFWGDQNRVKLGSNNMEVRVSGGIKAEKRNTVTGAMFTMQNVKRVIRVVSKES